MMHWYGTGWSWWQASLMGVGMIAFWGLVIWAVYALVTSSPRRDDGEPADDPRRILDARLARGEIDADDYRHRLDAMTTGNEVAATGGDRR
jgi:putative membrane protein